MAPGILRHVDRAMMAVQLQRIPLQTTPRAGNGGQTRFQRGKRTGRSVKRNLHVLGALEARDSQKSMESDPGWHRWANPARDSALGCGNLALGRYYAHPARDLPRDKQNVMIRDSGICLNAYKTLRFLKIRTFCVPNR